MEVSNMKRVESGKKQAGSFQGVKSPGKFPQFMQANARFVK